MAPEPTESHARDPPAPAQPTTRIDTLLAPALEVQDTPSPSSNDIDILTPNDSPSSTPVPKLEIPNSTHEETARSPALSDSNGGTRPLPDIAKARGLPVPAASVNHGNPSQSSFVFPDAGSTVGTRDAGGLAPEIARADVSISCMPLL
jgi:GDP/GTP exchange factor required for growth at low temperature